MAAIWEDRRGASILRQAQDRASGLSAPATASAPRASTCADRADVAEEVFEEAALTPQGRGLVVLRTDAHDLVDPPGVELGVIARGIEADRDHAVLVDHRPAEGGLPGVAADVIPHRRPELAGEGRAAEGLLDRLAVVADRLDGHDQQRGGNVAAVIDNGRAAGGEERRRQHRTDPLSSPHYLDFSDVSPISAATLTGWRPPTQW